MNRRSATSGFTLLELVTTMTIAAILAAIAVPSFRYVSTSNRMASEANELLGDMQFARIAAINEGAPVSICVANATGSQCGTGSWAGGWLVFSDPTGSGSFSTSTIPSPILRHQMSFALSNSADTFTSSVSVVTFNRDGFATGFTNDAAGQTLFALHSSTGVSAFTRCVSLLPTGSLSVVADNVSGCT